MNKNFFVGILAVIIVVVLGIRVFQNLETTKNSVKIGMVTFPGYAPLYLAQDKELWGSDLDVELIRIESIGDLRAAMVTGDIDMYAATYDIFEATEGVEPPGVAFLAVDESHGGDGVVVREGINSLSDLRGKTVGAEPGFPPHFILQYLLNKEGMTLDDVEFRDVTSQDAGNAFVAGQLDVAATYEPYLSESASKVAGAKVLVSSADTPGLIVDFLFASEDLVESRPEVLQAIAKGWFDAVEYWETNPDEANEIMGAAFEVSAQEMADFKTGVSWLNLEENKVLFDSSSEFNAYDTFELVGDILEANGGTTLRIRAEDHLTDTIIRSF
ncbi:MAG: ABC transporter substrate-binding protein [Candidatus Uhrbacteria bacterium]|nr:ABC transporter substrate-binding protein [Candidatus Uhrbacteria bacterium]